MIQAKNKKHLLEIIQNENVNFSSEFKRWIKH